jgi:hypothetical protein
MGKMEGRPLFLVDPQLFNSGTRDFEQVVDTGTVPDCVDWTAQEGLERKPYVSVELWHCRGCQTGRVDFRFMAPRPLIGDAEDESRRQSYEVPPDVVQNLLRAGPPEG